MAKDVLEIHNEVGKQDFLSIQPSKANPSLVEVDVAGPDGAPLYSLRPAEPLDRSSLLVVLAQKMSRDPTFAFGLDQTAYRWLGNRWAPVDRWLASLDYSMHALVRTAINRRNSSESLAFEAMAAWEANSSYPRSGLDLRAFGRCDGIPFNDFVLKINRGSWECVPHRPENFNTHVINISAEEAGRFFVEVSMGDHEDSLLMKFLRSSLDTDQEITFRRWLGYHLLSSKLPNAEKMLYMWGAGGNGKSQLLWLIRGLVGDSACAELRLPDLKTSANVELLVGKVAMLGAEAKTNTDMEVLKSLISREPINCNPKYRDPFTVTPECLITQASNQAPEFGEKSDAMIRRTISLHLKNSFVDSANRREDIAKEILEKELNLLVGYALWGAEELSHEGRFFVPTSVTETSKKTVAGGNPVTDFMAGIEYGPYEISHAELYDVFARWCREHGHRPNITAPAFISEVLRISLATKRVVESMEKATNYEPQSWIDENGNKSPVKRGLRKGVRTNILMGLRVSENLFGMHIGQELPASRRRGYVFDVIPAAEAE